MKKAIVFSTALVFGGILISCKRNIAHIHGSDTHKYSAEIGAKVNGAYFGAYELNDENFGTKTKVTLTNSNRVMVTNSLPNHKTGEFPNKGNPHFKILLI